MANLQWPSDLIPTSMQFYVEANTTAFTSPYTNQERIKERAGSRWIVNMQFNLQDEDGCAQLDALLASLRGRVVPIEMFDFRRQEPRGTALSLDEQQELGGTTVFSDGTDFTDGSGFVSGVSGIPRVGVSNQTGELILTTGWQARSTAVLKAGDYIEFGDNRLHIVTEDANSDAIGNMYVKIAPPVANSNELIEGTVISVRPARGLFRLLDNKQGTNQTVAPVIGTYNVNFVEVIRD